MHEMPGPPLPCPQSNNQRNWGTLWIALIGAAGLWLAFPPVGWSGLGWVATAPWVWLVMKNRLGGNRPYFQLWGVGLLYWLATFYFIPLPHPALWLGWLALASYLAIYTPLLIGVARLMTQQWKFPVWLAFPCVFTGLEWIRSHFATGMAMVCLSHSQYQNPLLIQVADIGGAYTLTFFMTMFAAAMAAAIWSNPPMTRWLAGGIACLAIGGVVGYGTWVLAPVANEINHEQPSRLKVGIVQGSIDVVFVPINEDQRIEDLDHYVQLTRQMIQQWPDLDLLLWPESSFSLPDLISDFSEDFTREVAAEEMEFFYQYLFSGGTQLQTAGFSNHSSPFLLAGGTTYDPAKEQFYNSAILMAPDGSVRKRYFKNHRVLLGEYVPLADRFPLIASLTPIGRNLTAGDSFTAMEVNQLILAPSICFETIVPHLIRRQVNSLASQGTEPDVLVNLTNDGWFFGTSCLDLHLASNVFRAVEMKKPHLVCANTGLSAEIDPYGRLLQVGPRRKPAVLRADINPVEIPPTIYRRWGHWLPACLGYLTLVGGLHGYWMTRRGRRT